MKQKCEIFRLGGVNEMYSTSAELLRVSQTDKTIYSKLLAVFN